MSDAIQGLEPKGVWKYFAEISKIPRGSKNEAAIAAWVVKTAGEFGLETSRDKVGNVVVRKPAHPSMKDARGVVLQGHLDMVCEKNAGTTHDFLKDPIRLVREGNVLRADGTTLGADNGVAVATNLAIMEDRSLVHGPLELLFTIDEETGLTGASNLDPKLLRYDTLLNLDSEEEGSLYVGCSGGKDITATWTLDSKPAPAGAGSFEVRVGGLRGGHSGLEIDKGRGNAIKILNRVLMALAEEGMRIVSINGGNKRNAIPRECVAEVTVPGKSAKAAGEIVDRYRAAIAAEFSTVDPDVSIALVPVKRGKKVRVVKKSQQREILRTIAGLPHGVAKMSPDIPGLVETSTNVAVISTTKKSLIIETSQRSSVPSEILEIQESVRSVFELGGAATSTSNGYPGWKPNLGSPILNLAKKTYRALYGRDPEVKAIHAGLECGIIGEKYPGMDMVSFGPTLQGVHSPDEKIFIDSVDKFWKFLLAILKNVA